MARFRQSLVPAIAATVAGLALTVLPGQATPVAQAHSAAAEQPAYWRIAVSTSDEVRRLDETGFDTGHSHINTGYATVIGDSDTARRLRGLGYAPIRQGPVHQPVDSTYAAAADTFYGGYRTAAAHQSHLEKVGKDHPTLTKVYDIGDSWLKTKGRGGHDIKAICITKKKAGDCALDPDSAKPRLVVMAQIHAREIATGEIAARWMDLLVDGYGTNTEITGILDTTEVWVIPVSNPDGLDIVAAGGTKPKMQRKNANNGAGDCTGTQVGVDLNRNSSFKWGAGDGSSTEPCDETYRGSAAKSEPEVAALERFFGKVFKDQRGPALTDAAPATTTGVLITLHSYGNDIIVPWGFSGAKPPNDAALRALGKKMAVSNGYLVGSGSETVGYNASGVTDDFSYGVFGVASYTFEIGPGSGACGGFFPKYSCLDSTLWPKNKGAFLTAATAAKAPYQP